jgi:hypothetical protein
VAIIVRVPHGALLRACCGAACSTGHRSSSKQQDCRRAARLRRSSEREHRRVLPCTKHVHKRLTHEKSNRDTDRNRDHSTPDIDPVPGCCDRAPSSLRQTRLGTAKKKRSALGSRFGTHDREGAKYTYRDQEEHASDHDRERSPTEHPRVNIPQQADRECTDGRDNIRPIEDKVIRCFVRREGNTGNDDHHDEIQLAPWL